MMEWVRFGAPAAPDPPLEEFVWIQYWSPVYSPGVEVWKDKLIGYESVVRPAFCYERGAGKVVFDEVEFSSVLTFEEQDPRLIAWRPLEAPECSPPGDLPESLRQELEREKKKELEKVIRFRQRED